MKSIDKKISVYDLRKILKDRDDEVNIFDDPYGCASEMLKYMGYGNGEIRFTCPMQHDISLFYNVILAREHCNASNYIITANMLAKELFDELSDKQSLVVGPYIAYADYYKSIDEIMEEKKKNGRTLLVFPTHGIAGCPIQYDMEKLNKEIDMIKNDYQTVLVCLFYHDIECGLHRFYEKQGYKVVSAGRITRNFISRLKYILELADDVIGNNYSTGLIYAIYMGKPVYLTRQEVTWDNKTRFAIDDYDDDLVNHEIKNRFFEVCGDSRFESTKKQKEWGVEMAGFNMVKSADDLKLYLNPVLRGVK